MPTVPGTSTNPYLSLVQEGKEDADTLSLQAQIQVGDTGAGAASNPYEASLLMRKQDATTAASAAILPVLDTNPDEYAQHLALAKESRLPVGAVQVDPQAIAREQRRSRIIDTISKSPTLQAWTAMGDNAALAMDDYENLSSLETALRGVRDYYEAPLRGFNRGLGSGIKGVGDLLDAFAYTADKAVFGEEHATQYLKDAAAAPWWINPSNALRGIGGFVESQQGHGLPADRQTLGTDIAEGFGNLIAQAVATRINPTAGVTLMAGQGADQQADMADKAGATADQKTRAVVLGAAITAASEKLGLDLLLNRLPPQIKNRAAQWIVDKTLAAGIEGTEEAVEQVGNNLIAQMIYDPNNPLFEGVADNATVGAGVGFLARSLLGLRGVGHERQNVTSEQTALDGMVTAAGASKLLTRAPERFQALVQQMAQAGAANVYVPAEATTKLFQSLTPAQVAEELGVPVELYMEAVITGGDVAIPVEQYLSRVAPQHHDALREVARFTPGAMTPAEAVEMDERAAEAADRFMASVQSEKPSDQMVHDDVTGMLLGTRRFRREDVERYAQLVQAGFRTLAAREGVDPFALYQRYRLRIKSELPAALQAMDVDTVIDPLIERLRTGDVPRGSQRQSLADFIAAGGGVDDPALAGEIATLHESDRVVRKGKAPLVRKGADRDLDRVREAAAEAGYLPADSDVNDLLALLENEMAGQPTYAMGDEADAPDDRTRAALDSLDEELSRLGIDIHTTSNADIKRALFGESGTEVPDALVQVFDQPAYHGTPHQVDRFSLQKIGTGEGAQAFGWGLYFASNREVADHYRKTLSDGTSSTGAVMVRGEKVDAFSPEGHAARLLFYNDAREIKSSAKQWLKEAKAGEPWAEEIASKAGTSAADYYTRLNEFLSTHKRKDVKVLKGNLYQVEIPDDGDLLDYDAPIAKQPAAVQDAARGFLREEGYLRAGENGPRQLSSSFREAAMALGGMVRGGDGQTLYEMLSKKLGSEQAASLYLHERGIPGLRFKAGQIAGVKGGGHNYVIWDESAISEPTSLYQSAPAGPSDVTVTARTKSGEFRLVDAAVPEMAALQTGGWTREIKAFDGEQEVGTLLYTNDGTPPTVEVVESHRRRGIATAMYALARRQGGDLGSADTGQTEGGQKSARSEDGQAFRSGADESTVTLFQGGDPTQTPEFKAWFGDSKVVDAEGKPLVVYHGSNQSFDSFDEERLGTNTKTVSARAFFFTDEAGEGSGYADLAANRMIPDARAHEEKTERLMRQAAAAERRGNWDEYERLTIELEEHEYGAIQADPEGAQVYPVYLSIKNPLQVRVGGMISTGNVSDLIDKAIAAGNDGLILEEIEDGPVIGGDPTTHYVAFRPEQIKSATANRGTFDPNNPSILFQPSRQEATTGAVDDASMRDLLSAKGESKSVGEETGREVPNGVSTFMSPLGSTRYVYSENGERLAVLQVMSRDGKTGIATNVYTVPEARRKGYASKLMDAARRDFERIENSADVSPDGAAWINRERQELNQPADGSPAENAIRRGYIKFGPERHFTVGLLEKADATTFLHETGHFFLEVLGDLAADPLASDAIRSDYATLLNWFGVESREQITVEHHEQFARGFEQYLGEGKAPTPELASAFARFKAWVKAIYRTLSSLNVTLTDDVRGVMDRLLATDEEITQAETSMDYTGLFADARSAGWSDAEFATRLQLQDQAREEAENRLMARAMKDVTRETKAWWKERSAEVREQVTTEVHAMPVYRAWALLANGTQPDGTPIEGAGQKLDKAWLVQQYGQEWLNKHLLRKRVYSVAGGADPDVVAHGVGFGSGDEMVRALANMQPMEAVIRAQTHQRMIDQYGDVLTDGTMPEQAMRAVHGSRRFKAMEADLKALERLAGDPRPSATGLRRTAELIVGQKKVRDLAPNTYLRAERKAAKEAIAEAGRQNWGKALEAQRRRLLNAHLFDVASKAQEETEKLQRYLKRFEKPALRARLGKIGRLDQVEALLAQYDLRTVSNKKLDQNKARGELLDLIKAGEVIAPAGLVQSLQGAQRTNWRDLTVEDLRGLRDILRQTEAAARAEYEALINGEKVKLDDIAEKVGSSTIDGGKPVMPIYGDLSPDESAKKWGKQMLASWLRPSALARLLDGGKDDGAWTRHVIQPIRRAVSEQLEPMKRKAQEDLAELYRKHYTVKEMAAMNERSVVPGLGVALSRWDVISLALNQGNAENRKAILDSEVAGKKPYTEAGVQAAMQTLDARDWAFVQDAWDLVDSFWPAIKEAQQRRKGIAPPKVQAEPFTVTTRDGQTIDLKGGYYPLKYNGRLDAKARQHEMDEAFERMRAGTLSATQTKYGHTQERVGSGRQPVMLSMSVLHSHINNVVMDLALGDVVNYTDRLLARPQVRQALIETGNLDALDTWKLWLKDTATGEIGARSGADQLAQFIRFGFTKSKVGFNAMTMVLQVTGLAQTIPVVGAGHTAAAALDFAGRPRAAIKQVMEQSAFMRTRYELNAFNKDIAAVQEALKSGAPVGKGSGFLGGFIAAVRAVQMPPKLVNWAFFGIRQMQILVDSTTWLAGYRRAAGEGKSHDEAVRYADGIVENAQTSGMFSDRSAIERGTLTETTRQSEFVKLWTTLMSYMIAKGNIAFESYRRTDFHNPRSVLSFGSDVLLLFAAEALLMGLIKGGLPGDDDDESWWAWTGKTIGQQAISTIPFVREVPGMKYGGGNTPIGSTAGDLYKAFNQTQQGEVDQALVKAYVNLIGTATGLPAAQINRAVDAYWREDAAPYEYVTGKRQ